MRGRQHASDNDVIKSVEYFLQAHYELLFQTGCRNDGISLMKFAESM